MKKFSEKPCTFLKNIKCWKHYANSENCSVRKGSKPPLSFYTLNGVWTVTAVAPRKLI